MYFCTVPSDPIFNFPCCVASHQFISTKMNLTYILISVNLFNFFKGGGDSFLCIYFIFLPVLVFLHSIFCL